MSMCIPKSRPSNEISTIVNAKYPNCVNCVHYIPPDFEYSSKYYGKCKKYGEMNIITGEINHDFTEKCRKSDTMCGVEGKHFVEEPNVQMKKLCHYLNITKLLPLFIGIIVGLEFVLIKNL